MKIEITKTVKTKEIIDVDLPYYYKQDLMLDHCDSVIYGRIDEEKTTTIQITKNWMDKEDQYELQIERCLPGFHTCYYSDKYKSTVTEYSTAEAEMLKAMTEAR